MPSALVPFFPTATVVVAIMAAKVVPNIVVFAMESCFPLASQTRLTLKSDVPLALFAQMPFAIVLANPANVLCAVVLARMIVSRCRNWHHRQAGQ